MRFDLNQRSIALSVGELSAFNIGPREAGEGLAGIWRAQLGTHWHQQLRERAALADATARFEVPVEGTLMHRGWRFDLNGRIDQMFGTVSDRGPRTLLREIKSVSQPLPADEAELRRAYPEYFVQAGGYAALWRQVAAAAGAPSAGAVAVELVFVEVGSGITQTVPLGHSDEGRFAAQLDRICEFLDLRLEARERLRRLEFRPAFAELRNGQGEALADLSARLGSVPAPILFEAPTGFGKTGVVLQCALERLRAGDIERVIYLTSKSTGQLQVVRQIAAMTSPPGVANGDNRSGVDRPSGLSNFNHQLSTPLAVWQVRNKSEHCVNDVFHCVRDRCRFLAGVEERWPASGLSRFFRFPGEPRALEDLRSGGLAAMVCPYEITRAALAFNDVWIGDYNYVFAPRNRGLFGSQPGFDPARTLLVVDEAHNLPGRVADCFSHAFAAAAALAVTLDLARAGASPVLALAWDRWARFLQGLKPRDRMEPTDEEDARAYVKEIAGVVRSASLDYLALGQASAEELWQVCALADDLETAELPRLWWSSRSGSLDLTCLDASTVIGRTLAEYGAVVLTSATFGPVADFAAACGIQPKRERAKAKPAARLAASDAAPERLGTLTKRDTRKLYRQITSGAALLQVEEAVDALTPVLVTAVAPWRGNAYRVAFDSRVDTSYQQRAGFFPLTATTIAQLHAAVAPGGGPVAVFFPSYGYAESVRQAAEGTGLPLRIDIQPRVSGLAAQAAWVEHAIGGADAMFLVLGSSFAESIDVLGGRISHAMVVGPALPEVNAVQRARIDAATEAGASREDAFRQVYQVPGMTKVNQALGRLVRAPGQSATVLLHCRRFLEPRYQSLLDPQYRLGTEIADAEGLAHWLGHTDTRPLAGSAV